MSRGNLFLIPLAVLLAALYAFFFTDWFQTKTIQIVPQNRPAAFWRSRSPVNAVSFTLDGTYKLTSVKVVLLSAFETNKHTVPVWHLISTSNSVPSRGFLYGMPIQGMKPSKLKSKADLLIPNTTYRLFVEAGKAKGAIDFRPQPARSLTR